MTKPTDKDIEAAEAYLDERYVFMGTEQEKLTKAFLAGRLSKTPMLSESEQTKLASMKAIWANEDSIIGTEYRFMLGLIDRLLKGER